MTPAEETIRRTLEPLARAPVPDDADASLFELGVLDSFGLMDAVARLEEAFGVKVPDADLTPRRFETLAKIESYFASRAALTDVAHLAGLGHALPARVVPSSELASRLGVTEEWILGACGIRERRWLSDGETRRRWRTGPRGSRPRRCTPRTRRLSAPSSSEREARRGRFPASRPTCSGSSALPASPPSTSRSRAWAASSLSPSRSTSVLATGPVLAAGAEEMSRVLLRAPLAKETAILFGDGAGACVVAPGDGPDRRRRRPPRERRDVRRRALPRRRTDRS